MDFWIKVNHLRHRDRPYKKPVQRPSSAPATESGKTDQPKVATILLTLRIENNSKFVCGKKRTIKYVESLYLEDYDAKRRPNDEYKLKASYDADDRK